jgi:hypothetical protein
MSKLAKKVSNILKEIQQPEQSGHNKHDGFKYSTRDDIFRVVRPQLTANGITLIPSVTTLDTTQVGSTRGGTPQFLTRVRVDIKLVDDETDEVLEASWEGEAIDHGGRGVQQAATQAIRFWMTNSFMLTDGSEEAIYHGSPNAGNGRQQQRGGRNVQRQEASTSSNDDLDAIHKTLKRLDFSDQQVGAWDQYMASCANAASIEQTDAGIIKRFRERFSEMGDEQIRQTVVNMLGADKAA